jgi:uncharacterized protein YdeI (YjbR/CyaY-like superfamily)
MERKLQMSETNPKVDWYFKESKWQRELEKLRAILLGCGLTEELKWGKPCYTFQGGNIAILQGFKATCALLFPKGALLKDPMGLLEKPGENSQSAMRIPFVDLDGIISQQASLTAYIKEAIAVEIAGLEVTYKKPSEFTIPDELLRAFERTPALKPAFDALTPGRQRAYLLHFSGAKQSQTRASRIEKSIPRILEGKGIDD